MTNTEWITQWPQFPTPGCGNDPMPNVTTFWTACGMCHVPGELLAQFSHFAVCQEPKTQESKKVWILETCLLEIQAVRKHLALRNMYWKFKMHT